MKRGSLRARLSRWLVTATLAAGVGAGSVSFVLAFDEAHAIQDAQLRDIAELVAAGRIALPPGQYASDDHPEPWSRIRIELQEGAYPHAVGGVRLTATQGFQSVDVRGDTWRVYVSLAQAPAYIVVAQRTDARDEIARDSALRTIVPMIGLLPVLMLLGYGVVHRTLRPVVKLAALVDRQDVSTLAPLPERNVPEELLPFVTSINRLMRRIGTVMIQQRRFVSDAAHELRTPLAALSLQLQNLENAPSVAEMHTRIESLKLGIERARWLVAQLLTLARLQAAETNDANPAVEWSEVIQSLIAELCPMAESRGIDLGVTRVEPVRAKGRTESFYTLARNAIDNALRYIPAGCTVDVRVYVDGINAVFEVEDNGPGLPAAELERVFEPFFRVPGSPGPGTGLGLAIVRDIAAREGGHVDLFNRPGPDGAPVGLLFRYTQRAEPSVTSVAIGPPTLSVG